MVDGTVPVDAGGQEVLKLDSKRKEYHLHLATAGRQTWPGVRYCHCKRSTLGLLL